MLEKKEFSLFSLSIAEEMVQSIKETFWRTG